MENTSRFSKGTWPIFALLFIAGIVHGVGILSGFSSPQSFQTLKEFNSPDFPVAEPIGALVEGPNGFLYGTAGSSGTNYQGAIFKIRNDGNMAAVLHEFGGPPNDGERPVGSLLMGADGFLYGATVRGGISNWGTVFRLSKQGQNYEVLHSFTGSDGQFANGSLVEGTNGFLYGTTSAGGLGGGGVVFKLDKDGSSFQAIYNFAFGMSGLSPKAGLVKGTDGVLYGTTFHTQPSGAGTIFRINHDGGGFAVIYSFSATSGGYNPSGLMETSDQILYGVCGGVLTNSQLNTSGAIFKLNRDGSGFGFVHVFTNSGVEGQILNARIVEGLDGAVYGTASQGGDNNVGTIFSVSKDDGNFVRLYSLVFTNGISQDGGRYPSGGLLLGNDGRFYGATASGGSYVRGTFFTVLPPQLPEMISVVGLTNTMRVSFSGASNNYYGVFRSTNFVDWQLLDTVFMAGTNVYDYQDIIPPSQRAYYRSAWNP